MYNYQFFSKTKAKMFLFLSSLLLGVSCNEPNDHDDHDDHKHAHGYVYFFAPGRGAGHLVYSKELLKGTFGAEKVKGLEFTNSFPLGVAKDGAYYNARNAAGDPGVQKVEVVNGKLKATKFIASKAQTGWAGPNVEVAGDVGFYFDSDPAIGGATSVQIFNPKTMTRTGKMSIPIHALSGLKNADTKYYACANFLKARDGKLFTQVLFQKDILDSKTGKPSGRRNSAIKDKIFVAVFDIKTTSFEKIISSDIGDGVFAYGYPNSRLVQVDKQGDLYLGTLSDDTFSQSGILLRIRSGQTDFDDTVKLKVRDLAPGADYPVMMTYYAIGNNQVLMRVFPESPHAGGKPGSWANWSNRKMEVWLVDVVAKTKVKVFSEIPKSVASGGSICGFVRIGDKIYIPVTWQTNKVTDKTEQWMYDIKTKKIEKVFTINGYAYHEFAKF